MIIAHGITKRYGNLIVLNNVDIEVQKAEVVSIVGPSGAGKTTLLHILGTLDKADEGEIKIGGEIVGELNDLELSAFRNKNIGFVFQFHHLLPEFTAIENVALPALIAGESKSRAMKTASELLDYLGLNERLNHKPSMLSGGEQQRISVARALINHPKVVFADEPSGNLDSENAQDLHELFFKLRKEFYQSFIIVTHNDILANMADKKFTMKDGNIISVKNLLAAE